MDTSISKSEIARRQLGTALALYIQDRDPVSVHCLACGGGEIAEQLTAKIGESAFRTLALETYPYISDIYYTRIRNEYWNAFKHAKERNGAERDDERLLSMFSERENETRLFTGWYDYMMAGLSLPIAAHIYILWFMALDPAKFVDEENPEFRTELETKFPGLPSLSHDRQKQRLRRAIEKWSKDHSVLAHSRTDRRPLILGASLDG